MFLAERGINKYLHRTYGCTMCCAHSLNWLSCVFATNHNVAPNTEVFNQNIANMINITINSNVSVDTRGTQRAFPPNLIYSPSIFRTFYTENCVLSVFLAIQVALRSDTNQTINIKCNWTPPEGFFLKQRQSISHVNT